MDQASNPCAGTTRIFSTRPYEAGQTGPVLCLWRALSQSTVVTEPQPPHCTLVRLLSAYRRLPTGVAAPGPVNRALGANELAEDAHVHSTKVPIDLVGLRNALDIIHLCAGATPSSGSASLHW